MDKVSYRYSDAEENEYALKNDIATIGVIASGFDYVYPTSNKTIKKQFKRKLFGR